MAWTTTPGPVTNSEVSAVISGNIKLAISTFFFLFFSLYPNPHSQLTQTHITMEAGDTVNGEYFLSLSVPVRVASVPRTSLLFAIHFSDSDQQQRTVRTTTTASLSLYFSTGHLIWSVHSSVVFVMFKIFKLFFSEQPDQLFSLQLLWTYTYASLLSFYLIGAKLFKTRCAQCHTVEAVSQAPIQLFAFYLPEILLRQW